MVLIETAATFCEAKSESSTRVNIPIFGTAGAAFAKTIAV
jgi:hypothetical protein